MYLRGGCLYINKFVSYTEVWIILGNFNGFKNICDKICKCVAVWEQAELAGIFLSGNVEGFGNRE